MKLFRLPPALSLLFHFLLACQWDLSVNVPAICTFRNGSEVVVRKAGVVGFGEGCNANAEEISGEATTCSIYGSKTMDPLMCGEATTTCTHGIHREGQVIHSPIFRTSTKDCVSAQELLVRSYRFRHSTDPITPVVEFLVFCSLRQRHTYFTDQFLKSMKDVHLMLTGFFDVLVRLAVDFYNMKTYFASTP